VTTPLVHTTRLASAYRRYLTTADAIRFASEVERHYTPNTLALLLDRSDIEMRRASALVLSTLGDRRSIEPLGRALNDPDRGVRMAADDSFRALLVRDAAPIHQQKLLQVTHLIDGGEFASALAPLLILCDQAPLYAEAHHQLGICWQGLENYDAASRAFSSCLWRCRYHYAGWLGLGRCRFQLGKLPESLAAFQRASGIHLDLETARVAVRSIQRRLRRNG
jgi:tetratricopeptide (TPR) repeat protein